MAYGARAPQGDARGNRSIRSTAVIFKSLAGAGLLAAGAAFAQAPAAPTVVEVQAGDSFSSIAARFTGQTWRWRQV